MENIIEWGALALVAIGGACLLIAQHRRIKRENAEALVERDRLLAAARVQWAREARAGRAKFQNLKAKRDWKNIR